MWGFWNSVNVSLRRGTPFRGSFRDVGGSGCGFRAARHTFSIIRFFVLWKMSSTRLMGGVSLESYLTIVKKVEVEKNLAC